MRFFDVNLLFNSNLFDFCEGCSVHNQDDPVTLIILLKNQSTIETRTVREISNTSNEYVYILFVFSF